MNRTLLYQSVRNGLKVFFPEHAMPTRNCIDVACAAEDTPVVVPPPGGPQFPMLLITGARTIGLNELVPYELEQDGIASEPGTSFSLAGINFAGATATNAAAYTSGLMFLPGLDDNDTPHNSGVLAFNYSQAGVVRVPGELLFDLAETNPTFTPAVATENNGTVYAMATSAGFYEVAAAKVLGGTLTEVGTRLTGVYPQNGIPQVAEVIDGHFCVVASNTAGANRFVLLAFSFAGESWAEEEQLDLLTEYSFWYPTNGALIGVRSSGTREVDVFGYTAAGGFELLWTFAPASLSPVYQQTEGFFIDRQTGLFWVANVNAAFDQSALYVLELDFELQQFNVIAAIEGLTIQFAYAFDINGDVVFADDQDFNGVVNAYVRTENELGLALSNGLASFDSLFVAPLD